jgi:hypothetical protein
MANKNDETTPCTVADYLEQDPVIRGQRYACISFVSPNDALASKDVYCVQQFLGKVAGDIKEMLDSMEVVFATQPSVVDTVRLLRERHALLWNPFEAQEEFRLFKDQEAVRLDEDFRKEHGNFKTTVQGVKIRGVYDTVDEAKDRAHKLKAIDGKFNVFVCEVGCWCPWDPSASAMQDVEYAETHLNTLMKKYNEQATIRDEVYADRKGRKMDEIDKDRDIWLENARKQRVEWAMAKAKEDEEEAAKAEEAEEAAKEDEEAEEAAKEDDDEEDDDEEDDDEKDDDEEDDDEEAAKVANEEDEADA